MVRKQSKKKEVIMFTWSKAIGILILVGLIVSIPFFGQIVEYVGAGEICVIQYPSGTLKVFNTPGYKSQWFGDVTKYKKSFQFWFSAKGDQGNKTDESIKCRFNEGGHAQISGGVRVDLPQDTEKMIILHTKFGSQAAIEHELLKTTMDRAVYMSGPLMSSQESSAEKRPLLLTYVEDQAANGVYTNSVKETKQPDPITGELKTVSIVEIKMDENGKPSRQEESPVAKFGITLYGLSINEVKYDDVVEKQIGQQQDAKMQVQIAIANSKKAEQDALTAAKQGEANAAKAKWLQEVEKATEVTKAEKEQMVAKIAAEKEATVAKIGAEKELAVATLAKQSAEQTKLKDIALGEGESTRMKLVMEANGALELKLKTYETVNKMYAESLGQFRGSLVPSIVMGGGKDGNGGSALDLINLLTAKTASDLSLDFSMKQQAQQAVLVPAGNVVEVKK